MIDAVDNVLCALQASLFAREFYFREHASAAQKLREAYEGLEGLLAERSQITVSAFEDVVIFDGAVLPSSRDLISGLFDRLRQRGVEFITFTPGIAEAELASLLDRLERTADGDVANAGHVHVGAVRGLDEADDERPLPIELRLREHAGIIRETWESIGRGAAVDSRRLWAVVSDICTTVVTNEKALLPLATLKRHDEYTFVHSVNVGILSAALAEALAWDPQWLQNLTVSALVHDVGKQFVPAEVLRKESGLTDEERLVMERHPIDGARLLLRAEGVTELAPVVAFEHHMGVDGSGYPERRGHEPHLASRIVQVADVFDALRTHRPYRAALTLEQTCAIMRSASMLDQHLVDVFLADVAAHTERACAPESLDEQLAA